MGQFGQGLNRLLGGLIDGQTNYKATAVETREAASHMPHLLHVSPATFVIDGIDGVFAWPYSFWDGLTATVMVIRRHLV